MPDRPDRGDTTYDVFETDMGWVAIVGGYHGVVRASLPEASPSSALDAVQPARAHYGLLRWRAG
jgi:hypothetical protein